MLFPQAWGLRVALHSQEDRDDLSVRDWRALFVLHPPFGEGPIRTHVESLFRWWGFRKCITHVSSIFSKVLCRSNGVEQVGACLVDAISVCFIEDLDGA